MISLQYAHVNQLFESDSVLCHMIYCAVESWQCTVITAQQL